MTEALTVTVVMNAVLSAFAIGLLGVVLALVARLDDAPDPGELEMARRRAMSGGPPPGGGPPCPSSRWPSAREPVQLGW